MVLLHGVVQRSDEALQGSHKVKHVVGRLGVDEHLRSCEKQRCACLKCEYECTITAEQVVRIWRSHVAFLTSSS